MELDMCIKNVIFVGCPGWLCNLIVAKRHKKEMKLKYHILYDDMCAFERKIPYHQEFTSSRYYCFLPNISVAKVDFVGA